ncbi:MAG: TlpA family protein disulfide reductase [Kiritimatiellae bacterium]|nr:TlpA family protein disulfide reductase [Kiritimatiellia bacterium]
MTKKTIIAAVCVAAALFANGAAKWKNLDDKSHVSGPKLTEADLLGKAVLVYYWDCSIDASVKYLPEVEKVWNSFKTKKFQVVGNYVGTKNDEKVKEAVQKNKVTFPVYYKFSLDPDPKVEWEQVPYFNVVNHRGVSVLGKAGVKEAIEAAVEAISAIGMPVSLCGDVEFKKFKGMAGQLKLGKNLTNILKTLEKKKADKDPNVSSEASEIISAVESAKDDIKSDIELYCEADPAEAIKLIQLFTKTWPKDDACQGFKEKMPELKEKAKEKAKADKEKAKAK